MAKNFWTELTKPFFCLAPMADVTDAAFRAIVAKYGKPDAMFTEFTSADGLCNPRGKKVLMTNLRFLPKERPIVAQLFGANPEKMREAGSFVAKLGFDGIDINMGCPDRKVEKGGAGAALIKNPELAGKIIRAAAEGVSDAKKQIPISVKTRLGYKKDELETWLPAILSENVAAVTIHARTRKEMSDAPAHWDRIKTAVEIRNRMNSKALIVGNGDIRDLADAKQKAKETGADGIMFGRAIFGNPFLFAKPRIRLGKQKSPKLVEEQIAADKLSVMLEHARLFEKIFGRKKNFAVMKKHFKSYANGFPGAKELRIKLMSTANSAEVAEIIEGLTLKVKG